MKITPKRAKAIVQRYHELLEKADHFLNQMERSERMQEEKKAIYGMPSTSLDYDGGVLYERNTACHCHPEMQTFKQPAEKFYKWLEEENKKW
jgi:hypothetical protein